MTARQLTQLAILLKEFLYSDDCGALDRETEEVLVWVETVAKSRQREERDENQAD